MSSRGSGLTIKPMGALSAALARLYKPPSNNIRGVETSDWMGPLQPFTPIAPAGTEPRSIQYWPGQNLNYTPRPDAEYSAAQLRRLATYFLARVCIENVKDIIADLPRQITLKPKPGETKKDLLKRGQGDTTLQKLNELFDYPDSEHNWSEWVRPLLEDMLVVDAPAVLLRRNPKTDELIEMRWCRGDLFTRYINERGVTPTEAEGPAYAQLWYGIPMVDLDVTQLVYKPRNIVVRNTDSSQLYGMSPTEQGAEEIAIGIGRMKFVLNYYTDGVIPDMLQIAPADVTADKILEQMQEFNDSMAGQLAKRRGLRTLQGFTEDGKDQILFPKQALLTDAFDEIHIRKIAFTYGTSPQRLMKQMNRASAEASQDASEDEGTKPWVVWLKGFCDTIIQRRLGNYGYQMSFDTSHEPDVVKLSLAQKQWAGAGLKTLNDIRNDNGDDPYEFPEANQPMALTATGYVPIAVDHQIEAAQKKIGAGIAPDPTAPKPGEEPADEGDDEKPEGAKKKKILKRVGASINPARLTPESHSSVVKLRGHLRKIFSAQATKAGAHTRTLLQRIGYGTKKVSKRADDPKAIADEIIAEIEAQWGTLPDAALPALEDAILSGVTDGMSQLDVNDTALIDKVNATARDYASDRSAEMIGKRFDDDGDLVDNPDAEWVISDTTRDRIREIITNAFSDNTSIDDIVSQIMDADVFSQSRADMIARTEVQNAQIQGNLDVWKKSGLVKKVAYRLSADHEGDDICDDNADGSPYELDDAPIPIVDSHPNCFCSLTVIEVADPGDDDSQ